MDKKNFGRAQVIQQQIACIDYDFAAINGAKITFEILKYPAITHRGEEECKRLQRDFKNTINRAWGDFINYQLKLLAADRAELEAKFAEL